MLFFRRNKKQVRRQRSPSLSAPYRVCAKYMKDTYNIPYLFITRGEFGLPNYGCKDFSDLHDKYTKDEIKQFVNETMTYVKIKYPQVDIQDADYSDLPYFM